MNQLHYKVLEEQINKQTDVWIWGLGLVFVLGFRQGDSLNDVQNNANGKAGVWEEWKCPFINHSLLECWKHAVCLPGWMKVVLKHLHNKLLSLRIGVRSLKEQRNSSQLHLFKNCVDVVLRAWLLGNIGRSWIVGLDDLKAFSNLNGFMICVYVNILQINIVDQDFFCRYLFKCTDLVGLCVPQSAELCHCWYLNLTSLCLPITRKLNSDAELCKK